ncbi:hypothetical protein P3T27_002146 [Kitasatospora sp. MAA19]|uniref:hypothetical protein n=1 Tax=Kitasatospora sp. MAA19 TaxID=3035090 RepID=UPI002475E9C9|nr:hypothetical protein [Kitasatospora sp. MAA19]MDH6705436.1 hypothetical protein [Kitasatospora sp. MAA19]
MSKTARNAFARVALISALVLSYWVGTVADYSREAKPTSNATVSREALASKYGEGFADSKAEDCDLGFQSACDWFKDQANELVPAFNDGFADAQQDNCDKGFQPACDWISLN